MDLDVRHARPSDAFAVSEFAAQTFPLACPPTLARVHIDAYIRENLSPTQFDAHIAHPDHDVFVAAVGPEILGYTLALFGPDGSPARALASRSTPWASFRSATRPQRCTAPKQGPASLSQPKNALANATRKAYGSIPMRTTSGRSVSTASTDSVALAISISSWERLCTTTPCSKSGSSRKRPSGSRCPPRRWQPPPEA